MKYLPLLFFFSVRLVIAQDVEFRFHLEPNFTVVERADYSRRLNGQYLGYVNQERRGIYRSRELQPGIYEVQGRWYDSQEIKKEGRPQALPLDAVLEGSFQQTIFGQMQNFSGLQGPVYRNFPQFPNSSISIGDRWEAPMGYLVEDLSGNQRAELPLYCGYEFTGSGVFQDRQVYYIKAQFALRHWPGRSPMADQFLEDLQGSHVVTITVDAQTMEPMVMRDSFQEQWTFLDGQTLESRGFNLIFYNGVSLLNRQDYTEQLRNGLGGQVTLAQPLVDPNDTASENGQHGNGSEAMEEQFSQEDFQGDVTLINREEGLTLSLNNLHFLPDQALILPEDRPLLDQLADLLQQVPEKTFLVTGHTADVGTVESQMLLSMDRAKVVVDELINRGIEPQRFIYIGYGGSKPLGDNSLEEGRRMNRRVEITILED